MFKAVSMMRLKAIVLAQDERSVLRGLGHLGAVHLTPTHPGPETAPLAPADHTAELTTHEHLRSRVQEFRQSLSIRPLATEEHPTEGFTANQANEILQSLEQKSSALVGHRRRIIERREELTNLCQRVSRYRGFEIPLDGQQFSFLHFATGRLPAENLGELEKEVGGSSVLLPLQGQQGQQSLVAIAIARDWPALESSLQRAGFQQEFLPVVEGTTVDRLSAGGAKEQEELARELAQLDKKLEAIAADFASPLSEIEAFADREYRLLDASQRFSRTESTVFITGWIPANSVECVDKLMKEITGGRYVLQTTPPDLSAREEVPVLLKHSRLLRPFEMLISTYGLPSYHEIEPTLFVALSYILMFGMMFGDAGHGMVLAASGLAALLAGRSKSIQDLGVLLLFAGFSSTGFGVVYGSYFGIEAMKKYAIWHDPLEGDPIQLMYSAIGIGIAMISLGLILNIVNRFRRGDVIGGLLDKFGLVGLLFYWGALILLVSGPAIRSWGLIGTWIILFLVVPIVGWSLKEPIEHLLHHRRGGGKNVNGGLTTALMESCVGAFEAILSYLANTISFVRLAAYAMSHAALLFAAFMVSAEIRDFPVGGSFWSLFIIILGNIVAIVLEGIIASVQALRLEYYEFFSKFYSGSGQPFEPFRLTPDKSGSVP